MKIGIANDHSAVDMKNEIKEYIKQIYQIDLNNINVS